jgi:type VI secretion system protein VasG
MSRTHYDVELEHWLVSLSEVTDADVPRILQHFSLDPARFVADLNRALDSYKTGSSRQPALSADIEQAVRDAWVLASINYGFGKVRSGTLLLAMLSDNALRRRLTDIHAPLGKLNVESFEKSFSEIVAGSREDRESAATAAAPAGRDVATAGTAGAASQTPALDQFTVDLTEDARNGKIDPVLGRDREIRQIIDILTRKRQNNPIMTGEAGVGKTAVVEGFALRIAARDVPEPLQNVALRRLDLGLLQAGAGVKGEFENRLKQVIEEVQGSPKPIILFIDEAHTMIGAGGQEGQNDAANLLKPALARGELRTVAATTWAEYKKYFEKDPALSRRFQVVKVEEPTEDAAIQMMRGMVSSLEAHHGVDITDEAVEESVRLSHRYIPARQLPDKCMSVLDTACARVAMGQNATPGAIEDLRRRIDAMTREQDILEREQIVGADHGKRLSAIDERKRQTQSELAALEERWAMEQDLVAGILEIKQRIAAATTAPSPEGDALRAGLPAQKQEIAEKKEALRKLQGDQALVLLEVDGQAIAEVISGWTGIPVGKMVSDEIRAVLGLADKLAERVIGQDYALETVARRIRTARAHLDNPNRPQGVFLLAGPSGVGKTETALALADALYGGERNLITINMSEYQEAHTVSSLKGSPPGYVGYGEGGVLTEAVRRRPHAVVLLDEVEKAHSDVMELFFQVFDKGSLEDGEGREIDFKNTIILLGSNTGTNTIVSLCNDPELQPDPGTLADALQEDLLKVFPPALLGRMVTVPYYPLSKDVLRNIIRLQLNRIKTRIADTHGADFVYAEDVVDLVESRCNDAGAGARAVDRILTHAILPPISGEILTRMAEGRPFTRVEVKATDAKEFAFQVD